MAAMAWSQSRSEPRGRMKGTRKFSSFIAGALIAFEGLSLALLVGSLYGMLNKTMTQAFLQKSYVHGSEASVALQDRMNALEMPLQEISSNNTLRVSLMFGVDSQKEFHWPALLGEGILCVHSRQGRKSGCRVYPTAGIGRPTAGSTEPVQIVATFRWHTFSTASSGSHCQASGFAGGK